jgi:hypothetical protein
MDDKSAPAVEYGVTPTQLMTSIEGIGRYP